MALIELCVADYNFQYTTGLTPIESSQAYFNFRYYNEFASSQYYIIVFNTVELLEFFLLINT